MYDFGFQQLYLTQITAHIMADNPRAIRFNQALGFKQVADQDSVANRLWTLSPSDYKARTSSLRAYLQTSS
jgi:RimJ/RimL family protein N-acetyltransferase